MIVKKYSSLRGPALFNRKKCTNSCDFITMEPIEEINYNNFISYVDKDNFIYGFDIVSLHHLIIKANDDDDFKNPYTRTLMPGELMQNMSTIIKISKILKTPINLQYENDQTYFVK